MGNKEEKKYSEMDVKEFLVQLSTNFSQNYHDHPSEGTLKLISALETKMDDQHKLVMNILEPISENYRAAIKIGKWGMGLLIFIGALIGILTQLKKLII